MLENFNDQMIEVLKGFELEAQQMTGWVLDYAPTELGPGTDWHYEQLLCDRMASATANILDIGTGGGEVLATMLEARPLKAQVFATEEYVVNAPIAAARLASMAKVVRARGEQLPFSDNSFSMVSSRHTALQTKEISRVLDSGGVFITQQVASDYLTELRDHFDDFTVYPDHFEQYTQGLKSAGLEILQAKRHRTQCCFDHLGHLVYMLKVAPWFIPGFSVDTHVRQLKALFDATNKGSDLTFTSGCYLIEARLP